MYCIVFVYCACNRVQRSGSATYVTTVAYWLGDIISHWKSCKTVRCFSSTDLHTQMWLVLLVCGGVHVIQHWRHHVHFKDQWVNSDLFDNMSIVLVSFPL